MFEGLKKEVIRIAEEMNLVFISVSKEMIGSEEIISIAINNKEGDIDLKGVRLFHKELIPYLEIKEILEETSVEVISGPLKGEQ